MNTRTSLLQSAEHLVRTRGFDAFSFADLSRDVGIRKASIHHYFPTKADLAFELVKNYCSRIETSLVGIATNNAQAGARLVDYIDIYRTALQGGEKLCLCVSLAGSQCNLNEQILERLNEFHASSSRWLEAVFKLAKRDGSIMRVGPPMHEARACLALMEGAQLVARAAGSADWFDQSVAALEARIFSPETQT